MIIVIYRYTHTLDVSMNINYHRRFAILYSRNEAHMWATKVNELNTSTYKRKQQKYYNQLRQTRRILTDLLLSCKPLIWPRFLRMQLTLLVANRSRICLVDLNANKMSDAKEMQGRPDGRPVSLTNSARKRKKSDSANSVNNADN